MNFSVLKVLCFVTRAVCLSLSLSRAYLQSYRVRKRIGVRPGSARQKKQKITKKKGMGENFVYRQENTPHTAIPPSLFLSPFLSPPPLHPSFVLSSIFQTPSLFLVLSVINKKWLACLGCQSQSSVIQSLQHPPRQLF